METGGRLVMPNEKGCEVISHAASSCSNVNFAFCGVCNRCGSAPPSGPFGGYGAGGHGKGRVNNNESCILGRAASGCAGLFEPNDWPCPMCGNINWAKRTKCNICNTTNKPGHHEGGVRGGRGGGYKELYGELVETKGRLKETEEDDGELVDEFGNLKKKFRAKSQQYEVARSFGAECAGWEVVELEMEGRRSGTAERNGATTIDTIVGTENLMRGTAGGVTVERGIEDYDRRRYQR